MSTRFLVFGALLGLTFGCGSTSADPAVATSSSDVSTMDDTASAGTGDATPGAGLDGEAADAEGDASTDDAAVEDTAPEDTVAEDAATGDTKAPWSPATYAYGACDATTPEGLPGCVDAPALEEALGKVIGSRAPGQVHWQQTRELCATTLTSLGYTVELPRAFLGGNVIGTKLGATLPKEKVIVGARLDGPRGCDAADGNATGVAAALELARVLSLAPHDRTLVVACWDLGEYGRAGSQEHADDLLIAKDDVVVAFALEGMGFTNTAPDSQTVPMTVAQFPEAKQALDAVDYRGVTLQFVGAENTPGPLAALATAAEAVGLPTMSYPLELDWLQSNTFFDYRRSDHAAFWDRGIPAVWVGDTGSSRNPAYRCRQGGADGLASLDLAFFRAATATTAAAVATVLDAADPGTTAALYAPACDLVAQNCGDGKRCVYLRAADDSEERTCIDVATAPKAVGESCKRLNGLLGEDDCAAGFGCSFYGGVWTNADVTASEFDRRCSKYCRFTKDCADGELCFGLGSSSLERTGLCRPACLVLSGACGAGQKCLPSSLTHGTAQVPTCMPAGPTASGDPCQDASECGVDLMCVPLADGSAAACRPLCNDAVACPDTLECFAPRTIVLDLVPEGDGHTPPTPGFGYCFDQAEP